MKYRTFFTLAAAALLLAVVSVSATEFLNTHNDNDAISPRANAYRSRRTLLPFNYYHITPFKPAPEVVKKDKANEDIGELLMGNRLVPTLYSFNVLKDEACKELVNAQFSEKDVRRANYMIENKYDTRMFLDDRPLVSTKRVDTVGNKKVDIYRIGYAFGPAVPTKAQKGEPHEIFNHVDFTIRYMLDTDKKYRIMGFHATPRSVESVEVCSAMEFKPKSEAAMKLPTSKSHQPQNIRFTYGVKWELSEDEYAIEHSVQDTVQKRGHKIAAMYGVLLTVLAGVVVAFVMLRTVRKDLAVYLDEELDEAELREESGWKLVRGDVFRAPPYAMVLATLVGAGCQLALTVLVTMLLCSFRLVDPSVRGHFLTAIIIVFLFTHLVSGFATARLLKLFGMGSWKVAMGCMAALPVTLASGVLLLNFLHWMRHTSAAIPFTTIIALALVWVLVSLPFGAGGVFLGYAMDTIAVTAKVSSIPRLIPAEAGGRTIYYAIFGSFVPFVACCVEMSYVLNAFWREEQMYMFGLVTFFLFTVSVLCVEVGIVVTYFTLRDEDYRWWWRSFGTLAAAGVYLFMYSVFFLFRSLKIRQLTSMVLFLAYMFGVSAMFGLALGTISFLGSLWLVQRMYGAIKAD